ncbi:hypothetical protein SNEBB_008370 [Seison nebaliae]|nr:hypothetical protein SNEBB_008370 [Seison nebaliae]
MAQHGDHGESELNRAFDETQDNQGTNQMETLLQMMKSMQTDMNKFQKKITGDINRLDEKVKTNKSTDMKTTSMETRAQNRAKNEERESTSPNQFIVGNIHVESIKSDETIIDWAERTTLYFEANRIPKAMWMQLTIASLPSKLRAIINVATSLRNKVFENFEEIIEELIEKTGGRELSVKFDRAFRNKNESPSEYITRLQHITKYMRTVLNKESLIKKQFIYGINDRTLVRKLMEMEDLEISVLVQTCEKEMNTRRTISELENKGLLDDQKKSLDINFVGNNKPETKNERVRYHPQRKRKFGIRECKFCKSNSCRKHHQDCRFCWEGNCYNHKYQKNKFHPSTNTVEQLPYNQLSNENELSINSTTLSNRNGLLFVNVHLANAAEASALIDTGANVSLITSKLCSTQQIIPNNERLTTFSGSTESSLGQIELSFIMNDQKFEEKFTVVDNMKFEMVLGNDFLTRNGINVFPSDGLLRNSEGKEIEDQQKNYRICATISKTIQKK